MSNCRTRPQNYVYTQFGQSGTAIIRLASGVLHVLVGINHCFALRAHAPRNAPWMRERAVTINKPLWLQWQRIDTITRGKGSVEVEPSKAYTWNAIIAADFPNLDGFIVCRKFDVVDAIG